MSDENMGSIKLGDRVRILSPGISVIIGRVVELRGPLGPNGAQVYRVRMRDKPIASWDKPKPSYTELLAEDLEVLPPKKRKSDNAEPPPAAS